MKRISILIIDESVMCRDVLRTGLGEIPDIELMGVAPNGKTGLARALQLAPDVVVLSTGIDDLRPEDLSHQLLGALPDVGILLVTQHDASSSVADVVVRTLEAGAFDFVMKPPQEQCGHAAADSMARRMLPKIRGFSTALYSCKAKSLSRGKQADTAQAPLSEESRRRASNAMRRRRRKTLQTQRVEVVVVGVSTGGPEALTHLLPALPSTFHLPVVIVIHMPRLFTDSLIEALDARTRLPVRAGAEGRALAPGTIYLAHGGEHLLIRRGARRELVLRVSHDPPRNGCKPSVDVLFESAAQACPNGVLAVLLTGMGLDGVEGLRALKGAGAYALAQDEATSVVWGMPGRAVRAGVVDEVLPLDSIARRVTALVGAP